MPDTLTSLPAIVLPATVSTSKQLKQVVRQLEHELPFPKAGQGDLFDILNVLSSEKKKVSLQQNKKKYFGNWFDVDSIKLAVVSIFQKLKEFFTPVIEKLKTRSFLKKLYSSDLSLTHPMLEFMETHFLFSPQKESVLKKLSPTLQKSIGNTRMFTVPELDGIELASWYLPAKPGKPTILLNYGRYSSMGYYKHLYKTFQSQGYGFFVYDYPGFGKSDGKASITNIHHAIHAAQKELIGRGVPANEHIIMGYSLGGAVTSNYIHGLLDTPKFKDYRPKAMILLNTCAQPSDVLRSQAQEYKLYSHWLYEHSPNIFERFPEFNNFFELDRQVGNITKHGIPTLILHSNQDGLFPPIQGVRLFNAARESAEPELPVQFHLLEGTHMVTPKLCKQLPAVLNPFIEDLSKKAKLNAAS